MDQKQPSSLARYLDGEFWEIKDAFRDAISKCDLFQSSRYVFLKTHSEELAWVNEMKYTVTSSSRHLMESVHILLTVSIDLNPFCASFECEFLCSYELTLDQSRDLTAERLYHILRLPFMREHLQNQVRITHSITHYYCVVTMVKIGCHLVKTIVLWYNSSEIKFALYSKAQLH